MSDVYTPPAIWHWDEPSGGAWANLNRPTAGATHEKPLPRGEHNLQLYSLATPNGVKVTVMLEELLELGIAEAEYDAWLINIGEGDQFGSGFVEVNPNSKIPALLDYSVEQPLRLFESGSILFYLAEKFSAFLPTDAAGRAECMNWLMWQMGSAPFLGGGFGHFYTYAPERYKYPINRYALEVKRQLDVLDKQLACREFIAGDQYTIADIAIAPWYGRLQAGEAYDAGEFLQVQEYRNLARWRETVFARPGYQRGQMVNKTSGPEETRVIERHSAADFEGKVKG
ncbi:glutathione-dependent disulfide-bond oxidoreductase [Halioxenophilus aromaticivorans]|uniref:Glutathione-dependent disulfide-bond oxidoreductase n=1 Tax=Halioxenophilus aromaticivorans TaxID=1306992 RepID=A0AAV3U538_9ALTE